MCASNAAAVRAVAEHPQAHVCMATFFILHFLASKAPAWPAMRETEVALHMLPCKREAHIPEQRGHVIGKLNTWVGNGNVIRAPPGSLDTMVKVLVLPEDAANSEDDSPAKNATLGNALMQTSFRESSHDI